MNQILHQIVSLLLAETKTLEQTRDLKHCPKLSVISVASVADGSNANFLEGLSSLDSCIYCSLRHCSKFALGAWNTAQTSVISPSNW